MFRGLKNTALLIAATWMAAWPTMASAQDTVETADASAFLVTPLSFLNQTDLNFGQIVPSDTNGTVTMDSAGNVTAVNVTHIEGTQQPAQFVGFGSFNQRVLINIDATTYTLRRDGGSETMIMDQVLIGSQPPIALNTNPRRFRIIAPDGFFAFTVAGRLQVGARQAPGVYTGEFTVSLEYE